MNFECLLLSAKAGNENAITTILQMYRPLLLKYAISVASKCHRNLTRGLFFCIFETAVCRFLRILGNQPNGSHLHSTGDTPTGTQIIGLP